MGHRHELPVRSVLLLVRPEANATAVTGQVRAVEPGAATPYLSFDYHVVRLWQEPLQPLLDGGLGTLPLAPLTDEAAADLRGVVLLADERIRGQARPEESDKMRAAMFVLLGLRYDRAVIEPLLREVPMLRESSVYEIWSGEGEARGRVAATRELVLDQAKLKFGEPDEASRTRFEAITDLGRLKALNTRVLKAESWAELLAD